MGEYAFRATFHGRLIDVWMHLEESDRKEASDDCRGQIKPTWKMFLQRLLHAEHVPASREYSVRRTTTGVRRGRQRKPRERTPSEYREPTCTRIGYRR